MLQALTPEEPEERFPLSGASLDISEFKIRNGCSHYLGSVCLHRAHTSTPPPPMVEPRSGGLGLSWSTDGETRRSADAVF